MKREIRAEFNISIFHDFVEKGVQVRNDLNTAGYCSYLFNDEDLLMTAVRQNPPHLIFFRKAALISEMDQFVQEVLKINPEILFVPIIDLSETETFAMYREYNFAGILPVGFGIGTRALWMADEICERLAISYKYEQIEQAFQKTKNQAEQLVNEQKLQQQKTDSLANLMAEPLDLVSYEVASSREELLDRGMEKMSRFYLQRGHQVKLMFLKYFPKLQTFVATQGLGVEANFFGKLSVNLQASEVAAGIQFFMSNQCPQKLKDLVKNQFRGETFWFQFLFIGENPDGVLVAWPFPKLVSQVGLTNESGLLQLYYERFSLRAKTEALEIRDPVTDYYLQTEYSKRLEEEISRSRRLFKAVSVIHFCLDEPTDLNGAKEFQIHNERIVKSVTHLIKKTSRLPDFCARLAANHFAIILPHCTRRGASIRAERIRRMVETLAMTQHQVKLSISCGISEFPTLCESSASLNSSAEQTLQAIRKRGPNKVGLAKPHPTHRPQFDVPPV